MDSWNRTGTSIGDAYLRSVLLALAKPNQLRHRQLSNVFSALEVWTPHVAIEVPTGDDLFSIDLQSDQGPCYATLQPGPHAGRTVRMEVLVYEIEAFLKDMDGAIPIPDHLDAYLLRHLADAWGVMRQRSFRRAPADTPMKVCVGMRAAHFFLSGGQDFGEQLEDADAPPRGEINPFMVDDEVQFVRNASEVKDVWDDAFDLRIKIPENPNIANPERLLQQKAQSDADKRTSSYHYYDTTTVDTSPGGYRVRWNEPLPANVQTGELVAMRDESDPRWCVAVIRWIRQDGSGTYMGIELLAPRAIPVAARVVQKKGGPTEFARAFLLPELKPIGQPATLVTPLMPFETGQKVHFNRQGIQTTAQLGSCLLKTESFNQFTFRMLDGYLENPKMGSNMSNPIAIASDQELVPGKG